MADAMDEVGAAEHTWTAAGLGGAWRGRRTWHEGGRRGRESKADRGGARVGADDVVKRGSLRCREIERASGSGAPRSGPVLSGGENRCSAPRWALRCPQMRRRPCTAARRRTYRLMMAAQPPIFAKQIIDDSCPSRVRRDRYRLPMNMEKLRRHRRRGGIAPAGLGGVWGGTPPPRRGPPRIRPASAASE